jgi:hypothetical protein
MRWCWGKEVFGTDRRDIGNYRDVVGKREVFLCY